MISQKVALPLFARRGRFSPPPPSEINSDGSTPTSGRRAKRPGRLTDFLRVRQQLNCLKALLSDKSSLYEQITYFSFQPAVNAYLKAFHGDKSPLYLQITHQLFQIVANELFGLPFLAYLIPFVTFLDRLFGVRKKGDILVSPISVCTSDAS